ncbi:MAG: UDP-N-acetylmuramoylalanyl-D-glutamate--2,6-diaminopimelate ligase, UDP-N-acetylmuramoyl-L-alanyl-D-glutamate--2,6-diaminopimelate ligase [candidate division Kazan bacterium GW2011_GWA1_50_15]|uniref:UDP-N-acetylmuramoyl-L-alanyl-D-glutamate-2, 6-diaminopimelate ligase n=2 Tax=Bacteria division Kazan-3B-28 TaxID=1798534 RepID=A0A0G1X8A3_UNCK3|nr:MAG: UDP-N-acetylmuramoylalanyl-D-glutamate--2,6-diaminopimelate ligase, UDP-N-acetylmuramoyl-L-alanyl-D-glutamate--2,6-diaminopimelate ligase [candidate division Kazan bacterium GW2011_GWA1_50_15]KKW25764.1 MAG: UDP-N-acetylmuramoyl-L-alanyl-D-glutamate-2,6-diaminopimelate ligase [candidate division Kazan bacterium GW2011_GWC1_52_13]KKW27221.1 MAG: UDP-N-acetylmuramoyl-L-alanyl-D-glutamate-2,6-diaminopimelate ligase [candidate division Kazan bacterium GW2011_GWB1_52_7]HAV65947.1 UDP-N-acetyl
MKKLLKKILGRAFAPDTFLYNVYHKSRGILASTLKGFPSQQMTVIGVTGTNGKTTTCNLLAHILAVSGAKVGLATTVNFWIGDKRWVNESKMTTQSPFALQGLLRRMADAKCKYAVIETSSHALAQHRTWGIFYDVAVFTNLTQDHFDYHRSFEEYRDAKAKLFRELYASPRQPGVPKVMVLNFDDPVSTYFAQYPTDNTFYYTVEKELPAETRESSLTATTLQLDPTGSSFEMRTPAGATTVRLHLPGVFNVQNALAAASAAFALGIPLHVIKQGLESITNVPGRMERIDVGQPFTVICDYAHTPDGFEKVFSAVRTFSPKRLIAVFGATGDRDKTKRPTLGKIASDFADIIILTEEDPGSEDPTNIINQIRPGIADKFHKGDNLHIVVSRKEAVRYALGLAQPGDTVLFLALGAQTKMATKQGMVPYDERAFIKSLLQ